MADVTKTIAILFEAVDNTGQAFAGINQSIGALAGGVEKATQPLADLTKGILAGEAAALALGAAFIKVALTDAANFNRELVMVEKTLDDGEGAAADYVPTLTALSEKFGVAAPEVANLAANLLEAGYSADQVFGNESNGFGLAGKTLEAVKVSTYGAEEASQKMIQTLAGFGAPVERTADLLDTLNYVSANNATSFGTLTEAMSRVGPVADASGLSLEQTAEILVPLVEKFQSGEIAATAFNAIMLRLSGDSKDTRDALSALGVSQEDLNGVMRPSADILQDLAEKWPTLTREQQLYTAQQLVGIEQAPKLLAILDDFPETLDQQALAARNAGSAQKELDVVLTSAAGQADQASVKWQNLRRAIGDEFKGGADQANTALGNLAAVLRGLVENDKLEPFFNALRPLFTDFAAQVDRIAEALPEAFDAVDWTQFQQAVERLKGSFGGLFDGLDLDTPEGLADAIQGVIDVGTGLINVTSGIIEGLDPLFRIIGGLISAFADLDPEVQAVAGAVLGFATTANIVAGAIAGLSGAIGGILGPLGNLSKAAGGAGGAAGAMSLLGPAIAAASVAIGSFQVGQMLADMTDLDEKFGEWLLRMKGIPEVVGPADDVIDRSAATLRDLGTALGETEFTMDDFNKAVEDGRLVWDDTTGKWITATDAADKLALEADQVVDSFNDLVGQTGLLIDEQGRVIQTTDQAAQSNTRWRDGILQVRDATGQWVDATEEQRDAYWSTVDAINAVEPAVDRQTEAVKQQALEQAILNRATTEYLLGWEKIKSDERVAVYEIRSNVEIARIEADAERVVAAYDSIARSFENTGEVLQGLFDIWSGADRISDRDQIEDWIRREYEIREKLADAQVGLIDAEIRRINAQTAMLARGGMDVRITSDGLEPALESFMFQVIDKVRLTVAGSYEEFLVGCGGGA